MHVILYYTYVKPFLTHKFVTTVLSLHPQKGPWPEKGWRAKESDGVIQDNNILFLFHLRDCMILKEEKSPVLNIKRYHLWYLRATIRWLENGYPSNQSC